MDELESTYRMTRDDEFGCPDCGRCDCVCDDLAESDGVGLLHVLGGKDIVRRLDDPMAEVIVRRLAHLGATVCDRRGDVFVSC